MSKQGWLVRHGEFQGNLERRIQGWPDYPLTALGRQQETLLAERLAHSMPAFLTEQWEETQLCR